MKVVLEINGNIEEKDKANIEKDIGLLLQKFFKSYKFKWEENKGLEK